MGNPDHTKKQVAQSEDLRQGMQRAGFADQLDISFLEEVEEVFM
jgi:hypothetical protein